MKILKPICINHHGDEPFCTVNGMQGECCDPHYQACTNFHPEPYECWRCGQLYDFDKVPEICTMCLYELTETDKEGRGIA